MRIGRRTGKLRMDGEESFGEVVKLGGEVEVYSL
jgi:hypothetical protein